MDVKIDIVVLWVDGSDPIWLKEKKYWTGESAEESVMRYRDYGLLKYWFRGIEKNAKWYNKIFFVTYGHLPKWLNINHEKLVIVKHEEFIPKEYLPTYNSNTIELNLHRIDKLSENFILFNDDFYLINTTNEKDFFYNDKAKDDAYLTMIKPSLDNTISSIKYNDISVINKYFDKNAVVKGTKWYNFKYGINVIRTIFQKPYPYFCGIFDLHGPTPYKKSNFKELWELEYELLNKTCLNKIRSKDDINHWLIRYFRLCRGEFIPGACSNKFVSLSDNIDYICKLILKSKVKSICINDDSVFDFEGTKEKLIKSFEVILPNKSSFEIMED